MAVYYNEIDPKAAEWLRQLIRVGAIADGDVDERDIRDVCPVELKPYDQCHFFAGIGVWSYGLRQAGWEDSRPVWTGSCPCQPFSTAGKRKGSDDERDLWWAFFWLIQQCCPETIFGEQVASKDGLAWWDVVQSDLEGAHYSATAFDLCTAGISAKARIPVEIIDESAGRIFEGEFSVPSNAPHIRQRLFWMAVSNSSGRQRSGQTQSKERRYSTISTWASEDRTLADSCCNGESPDQPGGNSEQAEQLVRTGKRCKSFHDRSNGSLANPQSAQRGAKFTQNECHWTNARWHKATGWVGACVQNGFSCMANADCNIYHQVCTGKGEAQGTPGEYWKTALWAREPGRTSGGDGECWSDAVWLPCRDGKARPAKPGTFPLVDGIAPDLVCDCDLGFPNTEATAEARVMRLKGYGNAIVAPLAIEFVSACMEVL